MLYRIVFRGDILPGRRPALVRTRASSRLGLAPTQVDQLFSGRTLYLKRNLPADETKSYVKELLTIGLHVRIEREPEAVSAPPSTPVAAPPAPRALSDSGFDPDKADMYTPTQLDHALSFYAAAYNSAELAAAAPAPEPVTSFVRSVPASVTTAPPTEVVPDEAPTPKGKRQRSLKEQMEKQARVRAAKPRKPVNRAPTYMMLSGVLILVGVLVLG
ncbi:hypothetical protein [Uliginosibacterium sp. H1]|uniref:hypothetical protein n=1 Tax=Uliginosibacterium sp. H1 TaxID=3114757 RepID=UPI002E19CEA8|nr:hypothetical protein [Uliginosibacterium sp. H1]